MKLLDYAGIFTYVSIYVVLITAEENNTKPLVGELPGTRVVGGIRVVKREQFAYQAYIRTKRYHTFMCGGSIIDAIHVLTAAHCCFYHDEIIPADLLEVVVGNIDQKRATNWTMFMDVLYIFTHPEYYRPTIENDIALMRVKGSFEPWTLYVSPIPLATELPSTGTACTISGFGKLTESSGASSNTLYSADLPILSTWSCSGSYGRSFKRGMFCAGYQDGRKDACQGDSGGPLVCNGTLVGVVSWGEGCARAKLPGVYTDVSQYISWIEEQKRRSGAISVYHSAFTIQLIVTLFVILCNLNKV